MDKKKQNISQRLKQNWFSNQNKKINTTLNTIWHFFKSLAVTLSFSADEEGIPSHIYLTAEEHYLYTRNHYAPPL